MVTRILDSTVSLNPTPSEMPSNWKSSAAGKALRKVLRELGIVSFDRLQPHEAQFIRERYQYLVDQNRVANGHSL